MADPQNNLSLGILPVDQSGKVPEASMEAAVQPETCFISVMAANNETGTVQPFRELAGLPGNARFRFIPIVCSMRGSVSWISKAAGSITRP